MKEKLGSLLNRSVGAFQIIMKNKLVNMGCFLFAGILHVMDPRGGLRWTAGLLALCVALYALISFIFVLSNKNETVGKGKSLAGSLVHGVMEGNKDPVVQGQKLMSKSRVLDKESKNSNSKWDRRMQMLENKQKQEECWSYNINPWTHYIEYIRENNKNQGKSVTYQACDGHVLS